MHGRLMIVEGSSIIKFGYNETITNNQGTYNLYIMHYEIEHYWPIAGVY